MLDYFSTQRGRKAGALLLLLACAALVGGCAGEGEARRAAVPRDPGALAPGRDIGDAELAGGWPDPRWWRSWGDPQLDALLDAALARSPRLAVAAARIDQARALAGVARGDLLPSVGVEGSLVPTRLSATQAFPPPMGGSWVWAGELTVGLSYELDLWGRHHKALAGALDAVRVAAYEERAARLALSGALVRTYCDFGLELELQDSARAILQAQESSLEVARRRFGAGLGTEVPVRQAETQIAATRAELERTDGRLAALRHQLAALAGEGPGAADGLRRPALRVDGAGTLPSRVPAELVGRRPDVVAARWRVERAAREVDVARTAFYPNVNLAAFAGLLTFGLGAPSGDSVVAGAGPAVTLPIFEGGKLRAGLRARGAEYDAAVSEYDAAVVDALKDVADALAALRALRREQSVREQAVASAERAHSLALRAFQAGLGEYLEVLQTEVALHTQRDQVARVRYAALEARAALNQALGGGLVAEGSGTPPDPHADPRTPGGTTP